MKTENPNRLNKEKSPYLLQHAHNPVDWFPWGPEAFAKALSENKPIFLSIGYSTCHWCHVMEHESFEDPETAQLLNEYFVAIKVDREERPDIDSIYMAFVTATTGSGGWPMSVFLTPEQKPFYGGTYFPPEPRWGSPGFKDLLWSVHDNWIKQEAKVRESSDGIVEAISQRTLGRDPSADAIAPEIIEKAYEQLKQNFDEKNGGFGIAPKFPMGHSLSFLLSHWKNKDQPFALAIVEKTLTAMARGGLCDQLGGGFHRYSTDAHWQVSHFEKMLYDQALLAKIYLEAYAATGNELFAESARATLDYVLRDMHDERGGFYSAEDADSLEPGSPEGGEKKEGSFYLWAERELKILLSPEEFLVFCFYYGIAKNGNAEADPHGEFVGKNILYVKHSLEETAAYTKISVKGVCDHLASAKEKLMSERVKRPRPHLDDKILTDWNGLLISSLSMAGHILGEGRYLEAAETAAQFILQNLRRKDGRLLHRYRDSEAGILAGLEDYAFLAAGLLDLFENSFDPQYFVEALRLSREMIGLFWDEDKGGFFLTPVDGETLIFRPKEVYDGAVPSGNSMAAHVLLRLYHFTFNEEFLKKAEQTFTVFQANISAHPSAYTQMMMALQFYFGPVREVVIAGNTDQEPGQGLLDEVLKRFIPQKTLIVKSMAFKNEVEQLFPFTKNTSFSAAHPYVTVCEKGICTKPVHTAEDLKKVLS